MELAALASGSSGNCFYIENKGSAVLIDAGISSKQICERLSILKKNPGLIKAVFITHEHGDHTRGADVFSRQFDIPIYATKKTIQNSFLRFNDNVEAIKNNSIINLGGMEIEAFSKPHSAVDPVSYSILNGKRISVITDIGFASKNVISNVSDSDFLFMEANHDEMMLEAGPYPYFLKKWIKSDEGHISNFQSAICVLEHASSRLKNIVLSHLSQINNNPKIALETFNFLIKERKDLKPEISISGRFTPTRLFSLK
jgi:phosphoribosyl 1,2-cyclic phosphodiesterase